MEPRIGIIGGSGLYDIAGVHIDEERRLKTPFGDPSDAVILGTWQDRPVAFLPRHGRGHLRLPSEINFAANIYALKSLGCQWVMSVSAVGSLKEDIHPGDMVIADQFIDRTRSRRTTFFGDGVVGHVSVAEPVCNNLANVLHTASVQSGARTHQGGTYLCIEGPQFSSRAESFEWRGLGASVVGMTNAPEYKLAREAQLCYATVALATDYDCWHDAHEAVSVAEVVAVMQKNVATAQKILAAAVAALPRERTCGCPRAAEHAIMTRPDLRNPETLAKLQVVLR